MKKELIRKAIKIIRRDIESANEYLGRGDAEMYNFVLSRTLSKADLLFEIGLLTVCQYERLRSIIYKMTKLKI